MNSLYCTKFLLLWIFISVDGAPPLADVTYEELEMLGASCKTLDNCKFQRDKDVLTLYTCHCGSFCTDLGTCCIDSPYRDKQNAISQTFCKNAYGTLNSNYFIKDECQSRSDTYDIWEKLCKGGNEEDLLSAVPVTSFSTNVTYKNYFCFRCNERGNSYRYWNIKLFTNVKSNAKDAEKFLLSYNSTNRRWVAPIGERGSAIPVTFSVEVPHDIQELPKLCVPNVISSCSEDWKSDDVYEKCNAYTSIVYFIKDDLTVSYRNPHCALCNFEILENMLCSKGIDGRATSKKRFSFTYLLDINRADGERVGEIQQCDDDSMWDPFFKKCRILKCALQDHIVRDGKCVPP